MATMGVEPSQPREHPRLRAISAGFWALAIGVIVAYAFFLALGAISPGDVVPLTVAVVVLLVLWLARAWMTAHAVAELRDPRLVRARERRGF
jgi:hypothetical protein